MLLLGVLVALSALAGLAPDEHPVRLYAVLMTPLAAGLFHGPLLLFKAARAAQLDGARISRLTARFVRLNVLAAVGLLLGGVAVIFARGRVGSPVFPTVALIYIGAVLVFALEWYASRHLRPRKGHCHFCDYDLTGNVSGRCPECGTPIAGEAVEQETRAT